MADQARTIRIPVHIVEVINKLARVQRQMLQDLGREPTPEELAVELDMTTGKVIEVQKYRLSATSFPDSPGSSASPFRSWCVHITITGLLTWFDVYDTGEEAVSCTGTSRSPVLPAIPPRA
jgi:hypothetical protein